jgi:E3 ubiquitin-protein ligase RFWD2
VTKRIKLYDYQVVLKDMVDIHYPSIEMVCGSKISCVTWSSFHKSTLASSDYDCTVVVWDANTAQKMRIYQVGFFEQHLLGEFFKRLLNIFLPLTAFG